MKSVGIVGFIGGGNMAEAFIKGLLKAALPVSDMRVTEPDEMRREHLVQAYGVEVLEESASLVEACDTIVLAVKPQIAGGVLREIAPVLTGEKLLISIAAGLSTAAIERDLDESPRVVRAMPNTPALVGEGATALCRGQYASREDLQVARKLFESVGIVQVVDESQMDAVTGLSGSGPGYIFTVIEALADGGVQEGLRKDVALSLAVQTVLGAALMAKETREHPALLRDRVCSPGGTTISAIRVLEERGLRATLMEAVSAATQRSRELGQK